MPDVQTGLGVRTSEAVVQLRTRDKLDAQQMSSAAEQPEPADGGHQAKQSHDDAGGTLLPSAPILENDPEANQNEIRSHVGELHTKKETHGKIEVPQPFAREGHERGTIREFENIKNDGTVPTLNISATKSNPPTRTWFIDRSAGDFVCTKAKVHKMSNVTKRISDRVSKVSHIARKLPRQLKVSVKHIKKKMQAPRRLAKYYFQRYRLFHRFDEGVLMDDVSWYSVTPEKIAKHIAERFTGRQVIVDLYSGAGGNSIQFALNGAYVIAVEISRRRIEIARNNARVYGVEQFIEFIAADVIDALKMMKDSNMLVDGIFLSPPWGGPEYQETENYDVGAFKRVVDLARMVTKDVGILVPRNVNGENVLKTFGPCEMEWNYLGNKAKTVTIYFGDLIRFPGDS